MRILVSSIVDLQRAVPNRLHHLLKHLSENHEVTAICINDWKKPDSLNMSKYDNDFSTSIKRVKIKYITRRRIAPFQQEIFFPLLHDVEGDYDLIFNYNTLVSGLHLSKKLNLPMIYDLADDLPEMIGSFPGIPSFLRPLGRKTGELMMLRTIERASKVTGISRLIRESYSIPKKNYELIPNGVNTELFSNKGDAIREVYGLQDNFVLGYVGALREWVDFTQVFQALSKMDNARLLMVGGEGMLQETKLLASQLGVKDQVIFCGNVPYNEVPNYISAMDACIIPFGQGEIAQKAFPLKLLEYMACEKPVISSNLRGVREIAGDLVLFAQSCEDYLSHMRRLDDANVADELGRQGRERVVRNYDWSAIARTLDNLLESVLVESSDLRFEPAVQSQFC